MDVIELRAVLDRTLRAMPAHTEELRALDAAIGDGDLGITVLSGSIAANGAVAALGETADIRAVITAAAKAFSTANPSTFAALVGGGLLAASKTTNDKAHLTRADAIEFGAALAQRISERGKAQVGDKTILDALIPSLETLRGESGSSCDALDAMIRTAKDQVEATTALQSAKGRAAWLQERSVGHADPGATAYLRFVQELRANWIAE